MSPFLDKVHEAMSTPAATSVLASVAASKQAVSAAATNAAAALPSLQRVLAEHGIKTANLTPEQIERFVAEEAKVIADAGALTAQQFKDVMNKLVKYTALRGKRSQPKRWTFGLSLSAAAAAAGAAIVAAPVALAGAAGAAVGAVVLGIDGTKLSGRDKKAAGAHGAAAAEPEAAPASPAPAAAPEAAAATPEVAAAPVASPAKQSPLRSLFSGKDKAAPAAEEPAAPAAAAAPFVLPPLPLDKLNNNGADAAAADGAAAAGAAKAPPAAINKAFSESMRKLAKTLSTPRRASRDTDGGAADADVERRASEGGVKKFSDALRKSFAGLTPRTSGAGVDA